MKFLFRMTPQGAFYNNNQFLHSYDSPFPKSDTVFKAIVNAWEILWGEDSTKKLTDKFQKVKKEEDIPFYLSSVFPVLGNTYFLPRPLALEFHQDKNVHHAKDQINWVSAEIYRDWLRGEKFAWNVENLLFPGLYFHAKDAAAIRLQTKDKLAWSDDDGRTRNQVNPITAETTVYPANQIFYAEKLDWYLLVACQDEMQKKLTSIFRLLADEGIGGRRNIGCGGYLYQPPVALPETMDFVATPVQNNFAILSLYYPMAEQISSGLLNQARYQLIERQGWHTDSQGEAKQQGKLRLFKEGSCFGAASTFGPRLIEAGKHCYHYVYPFRIAAPAM